ISKNNLSNVQTINFCLFDDDLNKYYNATYGSVNYYVFDEFKVNTDYVAQAESNTRCRKTRRAVDTIEFVTVHDTATLIGSVEGVADYLSSDVTSIHYTVGDYKTLAVVPEKYIAYNAGDGTSMSFKWQASGVLANGNSEPKIGVTKVDNKWYFTINDELTKLSPSLSNGEKTIKDPSKALTSLGPVWTIIDGEYYIGNTQAVFSSNINGVIGAYGGNCNSIGIEMNVNSSGDMFDTLQRTAKLVADILIRNNLDLTRVKQHNTWTGKNCPQVLLAGHYWSEFMKMVEIEYILMKDFSDTKISFKSNNPLIVTKTGRIINAPTVTTVVTYDVTVEIEGVSKTITLEAIVPGRTTWQELNGMYPTTKIINGGYYIQ
ncbi:MAG: N-acetylmuramoyl-L-alanine amidase, partial [Bacilli bacterium]|nr:N-acetylmuramoyl-L-alanine amidase [Bacilli bacterium]